MNFIPEFSININNAFYFSICFWLTNILIIKIYPSHYKERVFKVPQTDGIVQKITCTTNFLIFQSLCFITLFMPIVFNIYSLTVGCLIFILSFIGYTTALVNYASSNPKFPVTKGIYKISRNPQQVMTIFMWIGVSFITNSSLILSICILQFFTVYPTFITQEKFCINKYGDSYRNYMKNSPRYFIFI
jgi:protein-S-isoprenylcysteine O-methyltransferase Ste14